MIRVSLLQKKAHRLCVKHKDAKVNIIIEMDGQKFVFKHTPGSRAQGHSLARHSIHKCFEALQIGVDAAVDPPCSGSDNGQVPALTDEVPPYELITVSQTKAFAV